jgi:tetratricopeptide (TPR) repeat protein
MFRSILLVAGFAWASGALAQPSVDYKLCAGNTGTADERIAGCTRAIKSGRLSTSDLANTFHNRGVEWRGMRDPDRAMADYNEAIRLNPRIALAYYNRGNLWRDKRDYDRAIAEYDESIRLDPEYASAYNNRGNSWRDKRDYDRAIADYSVAIRLDPKYATAYNNRCIAWHDKGDYDRAIADCNEAIRLNPRYASAHNNRGIAWSDKRDYDRAISDYNEAIRLDPANASAHGNLAWLLATSPTPGIRNNKRALELAQKAAELTSFEDADKLDTLAAAHAAVGNFAEAVRRQEEALAFPEFDKTQGKAARRRLELYRQGKPYTQSR